MQDAAAAKAAKNARALQAHYALSMAGKKALGSPKTPPTMAMAVQQRRPNLLSSMLSFAKR